MNGFLIKEKLYEQINKKLTCEVSLLILEKKISVDYLIAHHLHISNFCLHTSSKKLSIKQFWGTNFTLLRAPPTTSE